MPRFTYIAKDRFSKQVRGAIECQSRDEALKKLQADGLFVIALSKTDKASQVRRNFNHAGLKVDDLCQFARQLAVLLSSGVTLLRSLEITSNQTSSRKFYHILTDITDKVKSGLSLTEALSKYPRVFSSLWLGLVDTGEASGNLAQVLDKLAEYLELQMAFKRKVTSALVYPGVLLCAAGGALFFFMTFIMPKFKSMFSSMEIELPGLTLFVFGVSDFLKNYIVLLIAGAVFLGYLIKQWSFTKAGTLFFDRVKLTVPGLKAFFTVFFLERMASTLSILFESGVPIVYALDVAIRGMGNSVIEDKLMIIKEKVKSGSSLASEFAATGFFPPMVIEMASIGEEVGKLPEMFRKISEQYKTQLEVGLERFTAAFEPIMIVVMGIGVGFLVIALFLPMFKMSSI